MRAGASRRARACRACAGPLTATSANISGEPPADDPNEVERTIGMRIDLLLDAGRTPGGPPSTIVDVTVAFAARTAGSRFVGRGAGMRAARVRTA